MSDKLTSPWPGPRPYTGDESLLLESRDDELGEFGDILLKSSKKVIQLSAKSGVGKTSFLQAKLLPALRKAGFITLLYRDWAPAELQVRGTDGGLDLYEHALRVAIADFENQNGRDLQLDPSLDVVESLRSLAAIAQKKNPRGVTLVVFDQFEELLRRDPRLGRVFLKEIIRIAKDAPVRQIISLRSEFAEDLRDIHVELGGYAAAMTLKELEGPRLRSVVSGPPRRSPFGVEVTQEACDEILRWWDQARDRQTEARSEEEAAEVNRLGVADVGLLHLQAVLWALYQDWSREPHDDAKRIDRSDVDAFAARLQARNEVAVITESLLRWVDRALAVDVDDANEARLLRRATDLTVPLAQQLSAGGYKTTAELAQLAETCVGDDLARLGIESTSVEPAVRVCLRALGRPEHQSDDSYSKRLASVSGKLDTMLTLSGPAIVDGRIAGHVYRELVSSPEGSAALRGDTEGGRNARESAIRHGARELLGALAVAIFRLEAALILREPPSVGGVRLLELVHDGFGPALRLWSKQHEAGARAAVESVVSLSGEDLMWDSLSNDDLPGDVAEGLCWIGCWVSGTRGGWGRISGVRFIDCNFRGTIFERVDLSDVTFDNCSLTGVLFRDCMFSGKGVCFVNGNVSQITFERVTATNVELTTVFGNCLTFTDLEAGDWKLNQATLRNVLFERSPRFGRRGSARVTARNSLVSHWHVDEGALAKLEIVDSVVMFSTADATDEGEWLTLTKCEQVGSLVPPPVLGPTSDLLDHGGPKLNQAPPELVMRPIRDVDPWTVGRDPGF